MAFKKDTDSSDKYTKYEFDVNFSCGKCASAIANVLYDIPSIRSLDIDIEKKSVVVEASIPSQDVKEAIESTGKKAVLKGYGGTSSTCAVAELKNEDDDVFGVIRFYQRKNDTCVIDGTIDGLAPGKHGLHIHEFGDFSEGCSSIGLHFNPYNSEHGGPSEKKRHYGDLGNITADRHGRASFMMEDNVVKVWDIIGRSIAVTSREDDLGCGKNAASKLCGNSGKILAYGIIARSSGLFQNPKRICQCDGVTVWDERKT